MENIFRAAQGQFGLPIKAKGGKLRSARNSKTIRHILVVIFDQSFLHCVINRLSRQFNQFIVTTGSVITGPSPDHNDAARAGTVPRALTSDVLEGARPGNRVVQVIFVENHLGLSWIKFQDFKNPLFAG